MGTAARSLKAGATAADRAIIYQRLQSAGAMAAPTPSTVFGLNLQGADWLHVDVAFGGGMTAASVTPWYWSDAGSEWVAGDQLTFTASGPNAQTARVEVRGKNRVWFVVDSMTGAGVTTFTLWAGYAHEVRSTD